ncbi:conserved hypothetical protein [Leifsonia xyli subsp. xyli str. CTCB07]|uniref:Integral membrane protein n=1 Tax=Leifsonia xyli subsp. xyli (strain CTCB07) TaxID=281090 RepID=Q6AD59_LEIXX|nr:hypothetical protein [Leifsonia xyli]AAT89685.1 conserved hypothetical protein [Leifsonia xyli subsp. xyli str. CTCB07]
MTRLTKSDLLERLAALEAENASLRARADGSAIEPRPDAVAETPRKHRRGWGWTLLAVALIGIGAVLAPVAVVAAWAKVQLTDTDSFVSVYAPLADDPAVQKYITAETVKVIQSHVDIPGITSEVVDGITELGTDPAATKALELLKRAARSGVVSLIQTTVGNFVSSDAFAQVFEQALRTSHDQLVATMQNDPKAAISVGSDGSVGIQLAPIIDRVKQVLEDRGIAFASQIPSIDETLTIAQNSSIPTIQLFYGVAVAAGAWLPWVSLGLLALGVIVARRRQAALIGASVALAIAMIAILAGIGIGRIVFVASLIPAGVATVVYGTVTTTMQDTAVAALVGWYSGPFAVPRRRSCCSSGRSRPVSSSAHWLPPRSSSPSWNWCSDRWAPCPSTRARTRRR